MGSKTCPCMDDATVCRPGLSMLEQESNFGKWVWRMLNFALVVSFWSSSPAGRRHGCVLCVDGKYIVATGYNGTAAGESPCQCAGKPKEFCAENCEAVHAEINALVNAAKVGAPLERCVAYITKAPCKPCRAALKNAGVKVIAWNEGNRYTGEPPEAFEALTPDALD